VLLARTVVERSKGIGRYPGLHLTAAPVGSWAAEDSRAQPQVKLAVRRDSYAACQAPARFAVRPLNGRELREKSAA